MAKNRYLSEVEKELQKKQELESKFEKLKEREEELIKMFENSNQTEQSAMEELKKLLHGKNTESGNNLSVPLNGSLLKSSKK